MNVLGFGHSEVGCVRDHNEDAFVIDDDLGLYLVADGMGGHAAGDLASQTATEVVHEHLRSHRQLISAFDGSPEATAAIVDLVRQAIAAASMEVYRLATSENGRAGMGTTTTLVLRVGDKGFMAHVGDSRLYLHRKATYQLSEDHSYVNQLVKAGTISQQTAEESPYANVITRAVGIQPQVEVDTLVFEILPGDRFLLCSDGMSQYVGDLVELGTFLAAKEAKTIARSLCDVSLERGGSDNVTVIVIEASAPSTEESDDEEDARSTILNLRMDALKEIALFRWMGMKELFALMEIIRVQNFDEGEVVVREGEDTDSLYVVSSGRLRVSLAGRDIATLEAGAHFGEMALLNKKPRSATVTAIARSSLLVIDRSAFSDLVQREPRLGVKLLWTFAQVLSDRLEESNALTGAAKTDQMLAYTDGKASS